MAHVLRTFIGFLLIFHFIGLFFVMHNTNKSEARNFFASIISNAESQIIFRDAKAKKPKIPFLILRPFANEEITASSGGRLALESNRSVHWFVDNELIGSGRNVFWSAAPGQHLIHARYDDEDRMIMVKIK